MSLPFFINLDVEKREVEKEWKKLFFSRIHRFQHTSSYADTEGMCENGYEGMPPVQEMITRKQAYLPVVRHPLSRLPPGHLSP